MMSPRHQFYVVWLVVGPVGLLAMGPLVALVSEYFVLVLFGWMLCLAAVLRRIGCPQCRRPIAWGRLPWGTNGACGWWFPPTHCETCGADLREPGTLQEKTLAPHLRPRST